MNRRKDETTRGSVLDCEASSPTAGPPTPLQFGVLTRTSLKQSKFSALVTAIAFLLFSRLCFAEFRLEQISVEISERGKVAGYILLTESNRFSFLPPPGWKLKSIPTERRIVFTSKDLSTSASFKLEDPLPKSFDAAKTNAWREFFDARFPDGRLQASFEHPVAGGIGQAFDFKGVASNNSYFLSRVVFYSFPGGMLEFNLTTTQANFEKYKTTLGRLMTSMRIKPVEPPKKDNVK